MIISLDDRDDAAMPDIMDVKVWKRKYEFGVSKIAEGAAFVAIKAAARMKKD